MPLIPTLDLICAIIWVCWVVAQLGDDEPE